MRLITLILTAFLPLLGHAGMAEDYQAHCIESQAAMASVRPAASNDSAVAPRRAVPARDRKGIKTNVDHRAAPGKVTGN
ncbi:MAG: hypothetical protein AB1831_14775 [Pseudomonadota bacterium]